MNKNLLIKGIKRLAFSLPLMFLGPSIIYNAFMNQHTWIHYLVLSIGIILCFLAVYLMFKGIMIMVKGIFNESD
jgi:uncharacterized protein (DUF983 family)